MKHAKLLLRFTYREEFKRSRLERELSTVKEQKDLLSASHLFSDQVRIELLRPCRR
jgi:hypothetical protein